MISELPSLEGLEAEYRLTLARLSELKSKIKRTRQAQLPHGLTPQEYRILTLLACGYGRIEIAHKLRVTIGVVAYSIRYLYRKLGVHDAINAAIYAWRNGIVSVDEAWEVCATNQWWHLMAWGGDREGN